MKTRNYQLITSDNALIKAWTRNVPFDETAKTQLQNIATLPFIYQWIAVMPDVHLGKGAAIGSVIPTIGAVIPAAVGVDIGCGMIAVRTSLTANALPDNLFALRTAIEASIPHGRTHHRGRSRDKGAWEDIPTDVSQAWGILQSGFECLKEKHAVLEKTNNISHLGTLGTGNHFIEVCLDENDSVWLMLHSGSRGIGNRIGSYFIELAKKDMGSHIRNLPDKNLAYLSEGTEHFNDYIEAVSWAQHYAKLNREVMMARVIHTVQSHLGIDFQTDLEAINCHHNYVTKEFHYGNEILVTRKGAVSAHLGEIGIIPGSMGERSFIVKGLGNHESFCSCSHGAGRVMSRTAAKKLVSLEDHITATKNVECRKDKDVIDESPSAYKNIDNVMAAQHDLVAILHTLKQVVCVKG